MLTIVIVLMLIIIVLTTYGNLLTTYPKQGRVEKLKVNLIPGEEYTLTYFPKDEVDLVKLTMLQMRITYKILDWEEDPEYYELRVRGNEEYDKKTGVYKEFFKLREQLRNKPNPTPKLNYIGPTTGYYLFRNFYVNEYDVVKTAIDLLEVRYKILNHATTVSGNILRDHCSLWVHNDDGVEGLSRRFDDKLEFIKKL